MTGADLGSITLQVKTDTTQATDGLKGLAETLKKLQTAFSGGLGIQSLSKELEGVESGTTKLKGVDKLVKSLKGLGDIRGGGLEAMVRGLKQLPTAATAIKQVNLDSFKQDIQGVTTALSPLIDKLKEAADASDRLGGSGGSGGGSGKKGGGLSDAQFNRIFSLAVLTKATRTIGDLISASNEYEENINLFTVAMGQYADEALAYAEQVQNAMGIDSSEWVRNQGVFKQIATGIGMASDAAYTLSQGLTQVAYDISSFYNISTEEAMRKVQSGIAGELEPLRRLGYALDQNTLQQIANSHGITMRVANMTAAQKTELRYVAIMEQSSNAINDMSRTINTSANQIRILKSQVTILARSFGNILIPAINGVLPVLINLVNGIASAFNAIAKLFGYALPEIDYGDLGGGLSDAADSAGQLEGNLGGAGGAAKKLKRTLMGFDELNLLQDQSSGGGGGGGGIGGLTGEGLGLDLSQYTYDFLDGLESRIGNFWDELSGVQAIVTAIAAGFGTWVIGEKLLRNLKTASGDLTGLGKVVDGLMAVVNTGLMVKLVWEFDNKFLDTGDASYLIADAISTFAGAGVNYMLIRKMVGSESKLPIQIASITLGISAITTLTATLGDIFEDGSFTEESIYAGLLSALKMGGSFALLAKSGIFAKLGMTIGAGAAFRLGFAIAAGAVITIGLLAIAAGDNLRPKWGDTSLTEEQMIELAQAMVNQDIAARITVTDAAIETSQEAIEAFGAESVELQNQFAYLDIVSGINVDPSGGIIVTPLVEEQIATLQSGIQAAVNKGTAAMDAVTASVNATVQLFGASDSIVTAVSMVTTSLSTELEETGNALGQAYSDALADGVIDIDEQNIINNLRTKFDTVTRAMNAYNRNVEMAQFLRTSGISSLTQESYAGVMDQLVQLQSGYKTELMGEALNLVGNLEASAEAAIIMGPEYFGQAAAALEEYANLLGGVDLSGFDLATQAGLEGALSLLRGTEFDVESYVAPLLQELMRPAWDALLAENGLMALLPEGFEATFGDLMQSAVHTAMTTSTHGASVDFETLLAAYANPIDVFTGWMRSQGLEPDKLEALGKDVGTIYGEFINAALAAEFGDNPELLAQLQSITTATSEVDDKPIKAVGMTMRKYAPQFETVAENMAIIEESSATPTIDIVDNASAQVQKIASALSDVEGTTHATLRINAKVSETAGLISQSMAKVLASGDSSMAKYFRNLYAYSIGQFASGGIPDRGTMFIAGEAGPEIVGMVGNRTGVANKEQISEIIASEMARQGGASSGGADVTDRVIAALNNMELTVDGETLGRFAVKGINAYQRRTGRVELKLTGGA